MARKSFEDLPNEVIYEIFEYLDSYELYQIFSHLNQRFTQLFHQSIFPFRINISPISKSMFEIYHQQIILPNRYRIRSLNILNRFMFNILFSSSQIIKQYIQLESIHFINIKSILLNKLLEQLVTLSNLHSLTLQPLNTIDNINSFYQAIFALPVLKYCHLTFTSTTVNNFTLRTNKKSTIEYFIVDSSSSIKDLFIILSYLPRLRRLTYRTLSNYSNFDISTIDIKCEYLTHINLTLKSALYEQFEFLANKIFNYVEVAHFSIHNLPEFLNDNHWQQLISSSMSNLRIFDLEYHGTMLINNGDQGIYEKINNLFTSLFWSEHRWFFHRQYWMHLSQSLQVYIHSINPYRRKKYVLYESTNLPDQSNSFESVDHLKVKDKQALINCKNYFPNVTKLFLNGFDQTIDDLDRIVQLYQLKILSVDCNQLYFEEIIKLLELTPNLSELTIFAANLTSIKNIERCHSISNKNQISKLIVMNQCSLKEVTFLMKLFPCLKQLELAIDLSDFQQVISFLLLSKRNLVHIYITNLYSKAAMQIDRWIQQKKWLQNYVIQGGHPNFIYLWL